MTARPKDGGNGGTADSATRPLGEAGQTRLTYPKRPRDAARKAGSPGRMSGRMCVGANVSPHVRKAESASDRRNDCRTGRPPGDTKPRSHEATKAGRHEGTTRRTNEVRTVGRRVRQPRPPHRRGQGADAQNDRQTPRRHDRTTEGRCVGRSCEPGRVGDGAPRGQVPETTGRHHEDGNEGSHDGTTTGTPARPAARRPARLTGTTTP